MGKWIQWQTLEVQFAAYTVHEAEFVMGFCFLIFFFLRILFLAHLELF